MGVTSRIGVLDELLTTLAQLLLTPTLGPEDGGKVIKPGVSGIKLVLPCAVFAETRKESVLMQDGAMDADLAGLGQSLFCRTEKPAPELGATFFTKLTDRLKDAKAQMDSFCADAHAQKIAYLVFDVDSAEVAAVYEKQIRDYLADHPIPGIACVLDMNGHYA